MAFSGTNRFFGRILSIRAFSRLSIAILIVCVAFKSEIDPITSFQTLTKFFAPEVTPIDNSIMPENGDTDKNSPAPEVSANSAPPNNLFAIPEGFEKRVQFWVDVYSKYSADDAIFHDAEDLSIIYKVVDLRPITQSKLHPFVKEFKVKKLIEKERAILLSQLQALKKNIGKSKLNSKDQLLFDLLKNPSKKSQIVDAIENVRMQLGQKNFVETALLNSDLYLPTMERIFEERGLPKELTRMPFVESSFNLAAKSKVGASGIWQIMPATGRKLIPNGVVDYRNDPIKATDFAAKLLKFNYKVTQAWPLAITAYNHGPTSIVKLTKKYNTKDLPTLIRKVYGTHAFGFASSNFYACFLAILEVEKNRGSFFPDVQRNLPLDFTSIQLKKSIRYSQLASWFGSDWQKAELYNPHLSHSLKRGLGQIPAGTFLYVPSKMPEVADKDLPRLARKI